MIANQLSELYANAPRYLRMCIDYVFEIAQWLKSVAEKRHPVDSVRAHLWAFTGRRMIARRLKALTEKVI